LELSYVWHYANFALFITFSENNVFIVPAPLNFKFPRNSVPYDFRRFSDNIKLTEVLCVNFFSKSGFQRSPQYYEYSWFHFAEVPSL